MGWHFRSFGAPLATPALRGDELPARCPLRSLGAPADGRDHSARPGACAGGPAAGRHDRLLRLLSSAACAPGWPTACRGCAAARLTTAEYTPIIVAAGLVVAAGTAALVVARIQLLRAFGPGLALTVLTAMAVSITLAPALIAIFGGLLFRPGPARLAQGRPGQGRHERAGPDALAQVAAAAARPWPSTAPGSPPPARWRCSSSAACLAGLLIAALRRYRPAPGLAAHPRTARERGGRARGDGRVPRLRPRHPGAHRVLVLGPGVAAQAGACGGCSSAIAPPAGRRGRGRPGERCRRARSLNLMLASERRRGTVRGHRAHRPARPGGGRPGPATGARAASAGRSAGLSGVRFEVGGETALTAETIDATTADMRRIAVAVLAVTLLLLALFLRALIAPVYLLAASVLALVAALGVTVWIFQGIARLRRPGLLRAVRGRGAAGVARLGLQHLRRRPDLAGGAARRPIAMRSRSPRRGPRSAITTAGLALAGELRRARGDTARPVPRARGRHGARA